MINNKEFTDELFKRMYELGYRRAEIESGTIFFYEHERYAIDPFSPRIPVKCTCFEECNQLIDIAEYLGVVDWSKVKVDTPILVKGFEQDYWRKRYFAFFKNGKVYAWRYGVTSWSVDSTDDVICWVHAKLAGDVQ